MQNQMINKVDNVDNSGVYDEKQKSENWGNIGLQNILQTHCNDSVKARRTVQIYLVRVNPPRLVSFV